MADAEGLGLNGKFAALAVGIYADVAYTAYSATNSSPQTTELFAGDRADTLWKYVRLGDAQLLVLAGFGALASRSWWPLAGAGAVGVVMHSMYAHAVKAGAGVPRPAGTGKPPTSTAGMIW